MSMIVNYLRVTEEDLARLINNPQLVTTFLYEQHSREAVDVDKAWHGIHYLLNGHAWEGEEPLKNVVLGGVLIGEVDVGYGPARGLSASDVEAVAKALEEVDESVFRSRFDASALSKNSIYPEIWDEGEQALDYLAHYYGVVRNLFQQAATAGEAVIVFMN